MSHQITIDWPTPIAVISFQDALRQNQWCWAAIDEMGEAPSQCRHQGGRVLILASSLAGHWYGHAWLQDLSSRLENKPMTGSGMGWACDFRIAERQARFFQPEIKIQQMPSIGYCAGAI